MKLESFILLNLVENEEYVRKCLPYLKEEYFNYQPQKIVFNLINAYVSKYNKSPSKEALYIELSDLTNINEQTYKDTKEAIAELECDKKFKLEWIVDKTEQFCQERAIHNALIESIDIAENKKDTKGKIPEILSGALAVSFDTNIGHDFIDDWEERYHLYTSVEERKPFSLHLMNVITNGGVPKKTLTVILAGTGGGKSRFMCNEAAYDLQQGANVLYITLEMADWRIAQRIDANILDVPINELENLTKDEYERKIKKVKTQGRLIVKEYPTATASALNFKHLLNELKLKNNFVPEVVYIDYINICASSRIRRGVTTSYEYIKSVAEELRGLGGEFNIPIITATQTNRSGFMSSDVGLEDTAESFGLPATADLMFALINTEELTELNQQLVKQLKNRLGDPTLFPRFCVGVDNAKMRYYDLEENAQQGIGEDKPVMDDTTFGERDSFDKKRFQGFF